jgi:endoglucanase
MNRRLFVKNVAMLCAAGAAGSSSVFSSAQTVQPEPDITAAHIPRWRGFNLQGKFSMPGRPYDGPAYEEFDFATMSDWGFTFARLPLSYWVWGSRDDWSVIREAPLKKIDEAVEMGHHYGIHINLNFHRIPGYCINGRELEQADLFMGAKADRDRALAAGVYHWKAFAKRYKGIPSRQLSFDLINEPPKMKPYEGYLEERYVEIVTALVAGIREEDPNRLIFADGMNIGQSPVPEIVDLNLVQSTRGYLPKAVSHYTATWVPKDEFETTKLPTWPLTDDQGKVWDKERLRQEYIEKYKVITDKGVQVHVGEWGAFNKTPHPVVLAWMKDSLSLWKEAGWGNAMWNFRGAFGVMDSERADVTYEDYKGHKLDREMLQLLQQA